MWFIELLIWLIVGLFVLRYVAWCLLPFAKYFTDSTSEPATRFSGEVGVPSDVVTSNDARCGVCGYIIQVYHQTTRMGGYDYHTKCTHEL